MTTKNLTPIIAIVGRPNVGKSSLFNRLIQRRLAITSEVAGTTRDRIYHHADFDDLTVILVDTGGLEHGKKENIEADVQTQAQLAIDDADLIYFMVDGKEGLTAHDETAIRILRRSKKPIFLIANKADTKAAEDNIYELNALGFGDAHLISAYHNTGIDELIEMTVAYLKTHGWETTEKPEYDGEIRLCFLGKPNVGKSSLVNALFGKEKVIVSEIAGTTRDTIDTRITWKGQKFNLIDTAGLRRRGKIEPGLEKLSTFRSLAAIERSDVVCLIMDYSEGIRKQDLSVSSYALDAGKGIILVINKVDLMDDPEHDEARMIRLLRHKFDFLPWAAVIFVSALEKKNVEMILTIAQQVQAERMRQVSDESLGFFLKDVTFKHHPPAMSGRLPKFYDLKQVGVNPPRFEYTVNNSDIIHFSYRRYLENELRKKYGFTGTSIKLHFRKKARKIE